MKRGLQGSYETSIAGGEEVRAFVPAALPPQPPLKLGKDQQRLHEQALVGIGRLDSITTLLPDTGLFLYSYVRKEALLSSQIEGTQSSMSQLLLFELEDAPGAPIDDVAEVSSYVSALEHGLERLRAGFPLSNRLIREIHGILLSSGRGSEKDPGGFRRSQNWIGGSRPGRARFVPPPASQVQDCMGKLESYLHNDEEYSSVLVRAALSHVQFETIHPFLDGNGRVGRLLIPLLLNVEGVLSQPLLYLSLYFKENRDAYYDLLQQVRMDGDWEEWVEFFLVGVRDTADAAVTTAQRLVELFRKDNERIKTLKRAADSALRVHEALKERPILSMTEAKRMTGLSAPTISERFKSLEKLGLIREVTGQKRNRMYAYWDYLEILKEGTEAL